MLGVRFVTRGHSARKFKILINLYITCNSTIQKYEDSIDLKFSIIMDINKSLLAKEFYLKNYIVD